MRLLGSLLRSFTVISQNQSTENSLTLTRDSLLSITSLSSSQLNQTFALIPTRHHKTQNFRDRDITKLVAPNLYPSSDPLRNTNQGQQVPKKLS